MRFQVEVDGEVMAIFDRAGWAIRWAEEYAYEILGESFRQSVLVVDVIDDNVLSEWTREFV